MNAIFYWYDCVLCPHFAWSVDITNVLQIIQVDNRSLKAFGRHTHGINSEKELSLASPSVDNSSCAFYYADLII